MIGPGWFDRRDALRRLADDQFDVLVIGGGITGAGVRPRRRVPGPAHRRWSSGTTSRRAPRRSPRSSSTAGCATSSRARSASSTRRCTSASGSPSNAPHLVKVLPFLIPMFTGKDGVLNPKLSPGPRHRRMWMYDLTGGARIGKLHKRISVDEALAHMPTLARDRLAAGVPLLRRPGRRRPPHAHHRPHRGASTTARPSPTAPGWSTVCSRTAGGAVRRRHGRGRRRAVRGALPVVVNAAGVWSDDVRALDEGATPTRSARPRASTSPCRGRRCATTSPSSSPCPRTGARSSWCRGATAPTSAPPTPTTTARSTTRSAPPRTSTTCSAPSTSRIAEHRSPTTTSSAPGPGCARW